MEEEEIVKEPSEICGFCKNKINLTDIYCLQCGYPENGGYLEQNSFISIRYRIRTRNEAANKKIKTARILLYVIGGLALLVGLMAYPRIDGIAILITNAILASIYVALGFWSNREPLMAFLMAIFLYAIVVLIILLEAPTTLYRGILWKILIFYLLIKGIQSAMRLKPLNEPLKAISK